MYVPPAQPVKFYQIFFKAFGSLDFIVGADIVIVGDFNLPDFEQNNPPEYISQKVSHLRNLSNFLNLKQFNFVPNVYSRILDLVLSNIDPIVTKASDVLVDEDPHHPSLMATIKFQKTANRNLPNSASSSYNFHKADLNSLYEALMEVNWKSLEMCSDVDTACDTFYNILYSVLDKYVPKYTNRKYTFPPWFTPEIIKMVRKKYRIYRKCRKYNNQNDWQVFKELRKQLKIKISGEYKIFNAKFEKDMVDNPKEFWRYVNLKKGNIRLKCKQNTPTSRFIRG